MEPGPTERLRFRPVTLEDVDLLDALNRAPGVMNYLDHAPPLREDVKSNVIPVQLRIARVNPGFGLWLAFTIESDECIGWFELEPNQPNSGDAEIGYRLFPQYWGRGFATEGAQELLRYALDDLAIERCVAITMAVNQPSRKVMERIGLIYIRTFYEEYENPLPGTEEGEVEYALTRDEWLLRRP